MLTVGLDLKSNFQPEWLNDNFPAMCSVLKNFAVFYLNRKHCHLLFLTSESCDIHQFVSSAVLF